MIGQAYPPFYVGACGASRNEPAWYVYGRDANGKQAIIADKMVMETATLVARLLNEHFPEKIDPRTPAQKAGDESALRAFEAGEFLSVPREVRNAAVAQLRARTN